MLWSRHDGSADSEGRPDDEPDDAPDDPDDTGGDTGGADDDVVVAGAGVDAGCAATEAAPVRLAATPAATHTTTRHRVVLAPPAWEIAGTLTRLTLTPPGCGGQCGGLAALVYRGCF